jgi:DNA polymerase-3 subunit epsilon|tara:strand:- start:3976 stop:4980 length:1005 start_codon:yes stop_codon:yes gene_type:complete
VNKEPDNFKLIRQVQFSEAQKLLDPVGDEINIVLLDFETTGLNHKTDKVIELGLVKIRYSPSAQCMTEISLVKSVYNDPGLPIPPEITLITGISDENVKGHKIDIEEVNRWIGGEETYIIAHNSKFDRPFFEKLMGANNYSWGCSANQIEWNKIEGYRIESAKFEYILLKLGYFYEGHRASIDCLAMVQMFYVLPQALDELLIKINENSVIIEAQGAPFSIKDKLKEAGYRWNGDNKVWWMEVPESQHNQYLEELDNLDNNYNSSKAVCSKKLKESMVTLDSLRRRHMNLELGFDTGSHIRHTDGYMRDKPDCDNLEYCINNVVNCIKPYLTGE